MIKVIDVDGAAGAAVHDARVRNILGPPEEATRVQVALVDVQPGGAWRLARAGSTQVAYVLEGTGARITHTRNGTSTEHASPRRSGVYLEPGEEAVITAAGSPVRLLVVAVPKHTARAAGDHPAAGYFFEEATLRTLVDERRIRERTFWVNRETGLSGSWDLQIGRMQYAPHAHSPRHVHHASATSPVTPEHFYFIEQGRGEVRHDGGRLPVGPGSLVLIPAGEWHQLVASETGLDYIEFQAPFDFVTTMDQDPLGKNWYIKGTDDGTGRPVRWVQS